MGPHIRFGEPQDILLSFTLLRAWVFSATSDVGIVAVWGTLQCGGRLRRSRCPTGEGEGRRSWGPPALSLRPRRTEGVSVTLGLRLEGDPARAWGLTFASANPRTSWCPSPGSGHGSSPPRTARCIRGGLIRCPGLPMPVAVITHARSRVGTRGDGRVRRSECEAPWSGRTPSNV